MPPRTEEGTMRTLFAEPPPFFRAALPRGRRASPAPPPPVPPSV